MSTYIYTYISTLFLWYNWTKVDQPVLLWAPSSIICKLPVKHLQNLDTNNNFTYIGNGRGTCDDEGPGRHVNSKWHHFECDIESVDREKND